MNIRKIKVRNFENNGRSVPNQFIIDTEDGTYFQSYRSLIVFIDKEGNVFIDPNYYRYSKTTGKYRNLFLGEDLKETERKLKSGEYKFRDLNS